MGFQCHVYRISVFSPRLSGMLHSLSMISCSERPRRLNSNLFLFSEKKEYEEIPTKVPAVSFLQRQ